MFFHFMNHGRRNVCKSRVLFSTVVGIICPLVEIGLTVTQNWQGPGLGGFSSRGGPVYSATKELECSVRYNGGCCKTFVAHITFTLVRMTEQISLSTYFSTVQCNSNVCSTENLTMRSSDTLHTALGKVFWGTDVKICQAVLSFCRRM